MKVMYVASNPADASTLNLEREITELQQRFSESSAEPVQLHFSPGIKVEDLPGQLMRRTPDILHLSAHGKRKHLSLANEERRTTIITAPMLLAFLPQDHLPTLIYLNACDSDSLAEELAETVPLAIGTTAPISNRAARASAVVFYERILAGNSVEHSFTAGQQVLEALEGSRASARLFCKSGIDPSKVILNPVPRIIAKFEDGSTKPDKNGWVWVQLGMKDCPPTTTQVVFFTDDESFIYDDTELADCLTSVLRGPFFGRKTWMVEGNAWPTDTDFRLYAVGVTGDQNRFTATTMLTEALEHHYTSAPVKESSGHIKLGMRRLRNQEDESESDRATPERKTAKSRQKKRPRSKKA